MNLDTATLFTVATCITGLLGLFLVVLWLQERSVRALAWWGSAYLMGASAVTLWSVQGSVPGITPAMPNALLFIACGMIWNGARLFQGRPVRVGFLIAGALVWVGAMQFDAFARSEAARVTLSSLVIAGYAFLAAFELRRERRGALAARWFAIALPLLHGIVFLAPIALIVLVPLPGSMDGLFALFALETLIYVVGTAFVVVVMAKERMVLVHKTAAMTDLLTGLFNRRALYEAGERLMAKRGGKSQPVSVLVFDLDHFKSINDRFGHAVGDDALKVFARTASSSMRSTDIIGRLGGEEFVAILPGNASDATVVAERVRMAFQAAAEQISSHAIGATVSVGIASTIVPVGIDSLLARADAALYRAKANGRNRIEHAPEDFWFVPSSAQGRKAAGGSAALATQ